ncbi:MAG: hypothetical protein V7746_09875 [Halioglobus sp.]
MKLVKKTEQYAIYQRNDDRYAVKNADNDSINGEEKVRILLEEGLIKVSAAAAVEEVAEEAPAEEAPAEEAPAEEAPAEEAPAEEEEK